MVRKGKHDDDDPEPVRVFIDRARCPECGSCDLQSYRTDSNGDETVTRRTFCRECFFRFLVVVE
jgi:hypothetical protein